MRRSTTGGVKRRGVQLLLGLSMVAAIVTATPNLASAVPPPPPNPSDSDLAAAGAAVDSQSGRVGQLIDLVASANQQLAALDDQVAIKREEVNKALVDLQNARDAADVAAAVVSAAQQALADAGTMIASAQQKFNQFAVDDYVKGTGSAGITSLLGAQGPQDVLDRAQILKLLASKQNSVLDNLQRARTDQANKDSTARASKQQADQAAADADAKKAEAQNAIDSAVAAQQEQAAQKASIEADRNTAQAELDQARSSAAGLEGQRDEYNQWDQQRQAEQAAIAAAQQAAKEAAAAAATRVAAETAANQLASSLAADERSHTDLDSSPTTTTTTTKPTTTKPSTTAKVDTSLTGSAAIELVVDRGMSQLGVQYSWGGGNANGPTKGIRDGGVADSYGDYNKVGFDCSGLMMYAFGGLGIKLPHYTGYQYTAGTQIPSAQMKRGDMIFYGPNASQHVALYLGDGKMLEAPQSGDVVKVSPVRYSGMTPYVVRMVD
ncbi:NlpC/P60 family protein [Actinomycetes bacterium M1A6_2h]